MAIALLTSLARMAVGSTGHKSELAGRFLLTGLLGIEIGCSHTCSRDSLLKPAAAAESDGTRRGDASRVFASLVPSIQTWRTWLSLALFLGDLRPGS
jgi:hypothetical protein